VEKVVWNRLCGETMSKGSNTSVGAGLRVILRGAAIPAVKANFGIDVQDSAFPVRGGG
jgi:hypothetical protein